MFSMPSDIHDVRVAGAALGWKILLYIGVKMRCNCVGCLIARMLEHLCNGERLAHPNN